LTSASRALPEIPAFAGMSGKKQSLARADGDPWIPVFAVAAQIFMTQ
jgi:hypothetical protein